MFCDVSHYEEKTNFRFDVDDDYVTVHLKAGKLTIIMDANELRELLDKGEQAYLVMRGPSLLN